MRRAKPAISCTMKILVTAFGPFGGRTENASSLALRGLKKAFPDLRTRVLPVDTVVAPMRLRRAIRELEPDAVVMLGEAAGSKRIRLETTAWNELDFRIPDNAGRQITAQPVVAGSPESHPSTLPLQTLYEKLDALGHAVSLSDDAGRYLCNQLFYIAAEILGKGHKNCPSGFIHLPLEHDYPTERVVGALSEVIRELRSADSPGGSRA